MNFDQWKEVLSSKQPSAQLKDLAGADGFINEPELKGMLGLQQDPKAHPEGDVWAHTLLVVDNAARTKKQVPSEWRVPYLFAALLHDAGKAWMENPDPHYKGHADFSIGGAAEFLIRIEAPDDVTKDTVNLIRWHHAPFDMKEDALETWKVIREQVPLKVLAWFSRCDSFAGARWQQAPVLAVHKPSEMVMRVEGLLAEDKPPRGATVEWRPPAIPTETLGIAIEGMLTPQVVEMALELAFEHGRHQSRDEDAAERYRIGRAAIHTRIAKLIQKVQEHVEDAEALVSVDDFMRRVVSDLADIKTGLKHLNEKVPKS